MNERAALHRDVRLTELGLDCFEVNFDGTKGGDPLNDEASRVSTLFVDLIDDAPTPPFGGAIQHGGLVWEPELTACTNGQPVCPRADRFIDLPGPTAGPGEEAIDVPTAVLLRAMGRWLEEGPRADVQAMMRGVTRELRVSGLPDVAACTVYALHTPGAFCDEAWLP